MMNRANVDVSIVSVHQANNHTDNSDAPLYALVTIENEFGNRACRKVSKARLGEAVRLRAADVSRTHLHIEVFTARPGSNGAAAWDDAFVGDANVALAALRDAPTTTTHAVTLAHGPADASVEIAVAILPDAPASASAASTPNGFARLADASCDAYLGAACGGCASDPSSPARGESPVDAAAAKIAALEAELAALRRSVAREPSSRVRRYYNRPIPPFRRSDTSPPTVASRRQKQSRRRARHATDASDETNNLQTTTHPKNKTSLAALDARISHEKCNGSTHALLRRQKEVSAGASSAGRHQPTAFHQVRVERPDTLAEQDPQPPLRRKRNAIHLSALHQLPCAKLFAQVTDASFDNTTRRIHTGDVDSTL
eukprot:CAMPEP_0174837822 /NCGR_PEP_ID=MMETSP1114-20130205/7003_1 /TAXON_ID=312471 /ORGANISM="Neobodo designis, Strain CCAP 1951/1" /LENGTH=370 /DNA_ID=CAMNT_0016071903 /DNA_START=67 /DNA_END=1180 /DNA_ORIENTATION=+